jgi:hypothetical protein
VFVVASASMDQRLSLRMAVGCKVMTGTRIRDIEGERARRRAAREMIGEYHDQQLRPLLDRVRDGFKRLDAGELDPFELDELIHRYKRSAQKLWSFCGSSGSGWERAALHLEGLRDQGEEDRTGGLPANHAAAMIEPATRAVSTCPQTSPRTVRSCPAIRPLCSIVWPVKRGGEHAPNAHFWSPASPKPGLALCSAGLRICLRELPDRHASDRFREWLVGSRRGVCRRRCCSG